MTSTFNYHQGRLFGEMTPLEEIAHKVSTPVFVYSHQAMAEAWQSLRKAFAEVDPIICLAVKANSSRAVMAAFASMGSGADIVSGGEMRRAMAAGISADKIVYSGVAKTEAEIKAALEAGILMFNVESSYELQMINRIAATLNKKAPIAFRINPDVDANTHPKITTGLLNNKFGLAADEALAQYRAAMKMDNIEIKGISCHIGSQLTEVAPFVDAAARLLEMVDRVRELGLNLQYFDIGGGLGITYDREDPPSFSQYAKPIIDLTRGLNMRLILEPGRSLVGNAGVLLTKVLFTKTNPIKTFVVVDAAMNDLIRPSFYDAYHEIKSLKFYAGVDKQIVDVVGPICESGDFLAKERALPPMSPGDYLAVMSAGAYGFTMSSNYNSRPLAAEVMIKGKQWEVVNQRQNLMELCARERIPGFLGK
jgi:diaminopimelate decarboxylase